MDTSALQSLHDRFDSVSERIGKAAAKAGKTTLSLVAVSKRHEAEMVAALAEYWNKNENRPAYVNRIIFGENYVQEALEKIPAVRSLTHGDVALEWHFIGHIQSRKAKEVTRKFTLIHTVDSLKLASALDRDLAAGSSTQPVLVQVNIGKEEQKSGVMPDDLEELLDGLATMPHLMVEGLMCLPPFFDKAEASRPSFIALRKLAEKMRKHTGLALPHLSMGMSHDMEVAIEEGATLVRIGTDIFGPRE